MLCKQHLFAFLAPFPAENLPLALIHSLLAMVLGALHLIEEWILSYCLEAQLEGGWMGLMLELFFFFACASSLTL
jgi:Zn-dependent protease with chaperone function